MAATGLRCKECGTEYPLEALFVCDECFGPLEVAYDFSGLEAAGAVIDDVIYAAGDFVGSDGPAAPNAVAMYAAITMCSTCGNHAGLNIAATGSMLTASPFTQSKPAGAFIQPLR